MAGFFSLGRGGTSRLASNTEQEGVDGTGGTGDRDNNNAQNLPTPVIAPETSWFLYRNDEEEITYRGSELWQQQRMNHPADPYASEVGPGGGSHRSRNNSDHDQSNPGGGVRSGEYLMMRELGTGTGGVGGSVASCEDCGNQAKKDCVYMRCRSCCKSRGFQCATHVRSTWVPAARRRERLQQQQQHYTETAASLDHQSKRHRESDRHQHASSSTRVPSSTTLSAGTDLHNLPSELSSEALFRCVKVSPIDEEDNSRKEQQFAYQTSVRIGSHVFKGILYDQGPETSHHRSGGDTWSATGGEPPQPPTTTGATSGSLAATPPIASSHLAFLDPSFYPAPLPSFMAGTQFPPNPRPP